MTATLYEGKVSLVDTETGETFHASFLAAINDAGATYTILPADDGRPVTISSETPEEARMVQRLVMTIRKTSPAGAG